MWHHDLYQLAASDWIIFTEFWTACGYFFYFFTMLCNKFILHFVCEHMRKTAVLMYLLPVNDVNVGTVFVASSLELNQKGNFTIS